MTREEILYCLKSDTVGYTESCNKCMYSDKTDVGTCYSKHLLAAIKALECEPLTDTEQRIFLAAMSREEKVCKEVDENYPDRELYKDSLVAVCRSIERKVKMALWK